MDTTIEPGDLKSSASQEKKTPAPKPNKLFGIRHVQIFLMFLGLEFAYGVRASMSVGIVAMTTNSSSSADIEIFDWSQPTRDLVLSSFFWGYITTHILGGIIAQKFGGKIPLLIAVSMGGIISLLIPVSASSGGWGAVCTCRVFQGFFQGLMYPSCRVLFEEWVPFPERGRLSTMMNGGTTLGIVLFFAVGSEMANASWGWPSLFYMTGIVNLTWAILFLFFSAASPKTSKLISAEERAYIEDSLGWVEGKELLVTPWRAIFTSLPFWALIICHCGQNWGFSLLLTEIPTYMKLILDLDIKKNGFFSAMPFLGMWLLSNVFVHLSDFIINRKILSVTVSRKVFNTIGHWGPGLALIGLAYSPTNKLAVVALFIVTVTLNAGHFYGFELNHMDLAPNFASILLGITNTFADILSILAPLSVGLFLTDETENEAWAWRPIFFLSSAIYLIFNLFWLLFGTSVEQPWNDPGYMKKNDSEVPDMIEPHLEESQVEGVQRY